jgi:phage N-6-adenine-methyltransferase
VAKFDTKFDSKREDWETPDSLFVPLHEEFGFNLDVCATPANAKCNSYFTKDDDGLKQDWEGVCWMNPPFGEQGKWVKKAYEEFQKGCTIVCLLPARTNTNWWHDYVMKGEIRFIKGRPKFKGAKHGLPQPLAIVIFRHKRRLKMKPSIGDYGSEHTFHCH